MNPNGNLCRILVSFLMLGLSGLPCLSAASGLRWSPNIIRGYNIYAPSPVAVGGQEILYFGGWLTVDQKPHDAIFSCRIERNAQGLVKGCVGAKLVANVNDVQGGPDHINDPSIACSDSKCHVAATVCVGMCSKQSDNQVWVGQSFKGMRPLVTGGAAEPSIGVSPISGRPVIFYTVRGVSEKIYMQEIDWGTLVKVGRPEVVLLDKGYAVSGVSSWSDQSKGVLFWNRFKDTVNASGAVILDSIAIMYSTWDPASGWSLPKELLPGDGVNCAYLTPGAVSIDGDNFDIFFGKIKADPVSHECRLTNWSDGISVVHLKLSLQN